MIVTVTQSDQFKMYHMRVMGAHHRHDFDEDYKTMDAVWKAAREVSEKEADFLTARSEGRNA